MIVSPADFELYSRTTGTPLPRNDLERQKLAPLVYNFIQNRGYQQPQGFFDSAGSLLARAALYGGGLALINKLTSDKNRTEVSDTQKFLPAGRPVLHLPDTNETINPDQKLATFINQFLTPKIYPKGDIDLEGQPIKGLFEYPPENAGGVDRFGNVMPKGPVWGGRGNYFSPEGKYEGDPEMIGTVPSRGVIDEYLHSTNIPQIVEEIAERNLQPFGGNGGNRGSLTTNLTNEVDRQTGLDGGATPTVVLAGTRGFSPAPAPRAEAEGLRDIQFSMKPPIEQKPSFWNPTGTWGVGDTANLAGSVIDFGVNHGSTVLEQGVLDFAKGYRDLQKGLDDTSVVIKGIYDAGAATRQLLSNTIASLPTSSSQQSDPLETGDQSILNDHPDVAQEGTGSDEVSNNRNHVLHGDESENASKEDLLNEMNRSREGEMAQDGPNKAAYDAKQRIAEKTAGVRRVNSLAQDALDHYIESGAMTVKPQDSASVTGFTMSPEMVFETQYKKTPGKRFGIDLSVRNTYSVDPSVVSEVANPDTFKEIEREAWKQQAERGEEVVDMMNEIAKTDKGAGFLANMISKDKDKKFIDAPREITY